jgi:hypothetical protein
MQEPEYILTNGTRIRTAARLTDKPGYSVTPRHLEFRRADTVGVITGVVAGHGGDVYWVAHLDATATAAYGWDEFELDPAKNPCKVCQGMGFDWEASKPASRGIACAACRGTAEDPASIPTAWDRVGNDL